MDEGDRLDQEARAEMTRHLRDAHAEAERGHLDEAALGARCALEAWERAGCPDVVEHLPHDD